MPGKTLHILFKRLRNLRHKHQLTQERFAELAGISYKYYQQVEAGRKRNLRFSTLERFADAYGLDLWQLLLPERLFDDMAFAKMPKAKVPKPARKLARGLNSIRASGKKHFSRTPLPGTRS